MTKTTFLYQLKNQLSLIPEKEREERISFYSEMIDDRIEEGICEEEAVESIGSLDTIVHDILEEIRLSKQSDTSAKTKKQWKAWEIVLLALGSLLWIVLIASAFVVLLSFFLSLWSVVASLLAVGISLPVASIGSLVIFAISLLGGNLPFGFVMLGVAVFSAGLSIFAFFGVKLAIKGAWILTKKTVSGILQLFHRKEEQE